MHGASPRSFLRFNRAAFEIKDSLKKKKHVVFWVNVLLSSASGELSEQIHQRGNGLLFSKINHELNNVLTL